MSKKQYRLRHALPIGLVPLLAVIIELGYSIWDGPIAWWFNNPSDLVVHMIYTFESHLSMYGMLELLFGMILAIVWWVVDNSSASDVTED